MSDSQQLPAILVVGAGPVGLTMAAELARHGCRPRIIDRAPKPSPYCRALGVTPRTLEVWEDMGIVREMIDAGIWIDAQRFIVNGQARDRRIELSDLPYSALGLPQYETERHLTKHLNTFGIQIERGIALESLEQTEGKVQTVLVDGSGRREAVSFDYVVGCDGAHSTVRHSLGIAFEGEAIPYEFMLADVHIQWKVPRGVSVRALRPIEDAAPEMFIAVPLPEEGRYRISTLASPEVSPQGTGAGHGIQSERPAPGIDHFQAIADDLLPEKAVLSDPRWSSIFRISMRLAAHYQSQNVFLAGDAAHIHPPTGGQGMNTGIQDAYNLAWKLALVANGKAKKSLLDSYEAERRPVGADVIARTVEASVKLGREKGEPDRLADTQILVTYRGTPWVGQHARPGDGNIGPGAGDRAADCHGLRRHGIGYPLRFFDVLRGTQHVFVAYCVGSDPGSEICRLSENVKDMGTPGLLRFAVIVESEARAIDRAGLPVYHDADGDFRRIYGPAPTALLVRPDGHLAWRGVCGNDNSLREVLGRTFLPNPTG